MFSNNTSRKQKSLILLITLLSISSIVLYSLFSIEQTKAALQDEFETLSHKIKISVNYLQTSDSPKSHNRCKLTPIIHRIITNHSNYSSIISSQNIKIEFQYPTTDISKTQPYLESSCRISDVIDKPLNLEQNDSLGNSKLVSLIPIYNREDNLISNLDSAKIDNQTIKIDQYILLSLKLPSSPYKLILTKLNYHTTLTTLILIFTLISIYLYIYNRIKKSRISPQQQYSLEKLNKIELTQNNKLTKGTSALIIRYNQLIDYYENHCQSTVQFERDATWREIAKQVAHEIRNPLTPMRLKIQMLQRYRDQNSEEYLKRVDDTLETLLEQIELLSRIADEFSDMSKIPNSTLTKTDIITVINSAITLYAIKDNITIELQKINKTQTENYIALINNTAMFRVLINILKNGHQAANGAQCTIIIRAIKTAQEITIEIENNGPKIEPDVLTKIFDLNFSTKDNGSGIGLTICRGIIESFSGTISARNLDSKQGVVFTIKLPNQE